MENIWLASILFILLSIVSIIAIRWRLYINKLTEVIHQQNDQIVKLSEKPVAVEESSSNDSIDITSTIVNSSITPAIDSPEENSVQIGIRAFMKGNFEKAAKIIPYWAEQDHLKAQTILAKMYFSGNGVEANKDKYRYWLERAAANGHKPSKAKLKKL